LLRNWFKPEVTLAGVIDGNINFKAPKSTPAILDANIQTRDAKLFYQFQGGNVETYSLRQATVNTSLKNNVLNASLVMDWDKYGSISADGKYTLTDKKIQAKASAALPNLAPLEGLLPMLNNVAGSAAGNVNVAGTLDKPEVTGRFELTGGSANLTKLGLELKNISFLITSPSINSARIEGKITSGDGTLVTQGNFMNIGSPDWHAQANVFGADIRVIQQAQLSANISPNLKINASSKAIELTGSTEIPWARAHLKNLPESATRVSSDVVIIENNSSLEAVAKKSIPFYTDIILYFGDDVLFRGFGLDTRLTGKVNVLKEENRQMFTTGFVAIEKGVYKAYGQELNIERGRLIFQGPYDNPGLDIRAMRVTEDVTAGLDIAGTLQRPKSSVFAIPAKSDAEAMAILVTGKPLSRSSKDDAYSIIGAIGKLGMNQGDNQGDSMTDEIAKKVGLDEISVKADKGLKQSELWIGKNITPRLFVHYIVGVFDQAFGLAMTYKISDRVQLEAESGKTQSLDVIYKIER
jgi:translocation and assembly module TamB